MSTVEDLVGEARDMLTVRRVYGEPYERNGITVIPAAAIRGGGGGGQGEAADGGDTGSGMGFGMTARPVGAYRIRDDDVEWVPAQDQTRVLIGAQVMAVIALVAIRSLAKMRSRPRTQE